ncbi:MAG: OsmC family protein [Solirubrobacterales bacterium]|nr:OsmC family protein [Solirubrobacterales bacterium]
MKATSTRAGHFKQSVRVRSHQLTVDEPKDIGGQDSGPSPEELLAAALASCTAITMEMYAQRKGWDIDGVEVEADYTPGERGCPTRFAMTLRLPENMPEEIARKLQIIAAKCPVHRTLESEVMFEEHVERVSLAH